VRRDRVADLCSRFVCCANDADSFAAIWAMFGVANQMLAVIALAIVSVYLFNEGRAKYLWVTVIPLLVVMTTTSTAAVQILLGKIVGIQTQLAKQTLTAAESALLRNSVITASLLVAMLACTFVIVIAAGMKISAPKARETSFAVSPTTTYTPLD
jgi:carbon starvation protein